MFAALKRDKGKSKYHFFSDCSTLPASGGLRSAFFFVTGTSFRLYTMPQKNCD